MCFFDPDKILKIIWCYSLYIIYHKAADISDFAKMEWLSVSIYSFTVYAVTILLVISDEYIFCISVQKIRPLCSFPHRSGTIGKGHIFTVVGIAPCVFMLATKRNILADDDDRF